MIDVLTIRQTYLLSKIFGNAGRRRVGTGNLDWSKGGNGFRSLCRCGWWHSSLRHHAARRQ
jgi:hypothetical protein